MTIAQNFPDAVTLGEPIQAHGLSVFPLFRIHAGQTAFTTLGQALEGKQARILEAKGTEGPWFRQVEIQNLGALPILVRDGDLIQGGQQDRVADHPVWIPAGAACVVPVSCVEQNRSSYEGQIDFCMAPSQASPAFRRHRMQRGDQASTWAFVADARRSQGYQEGAGSMVDLTRARRERAASMGGDFRLPAEACGVVVARKRGAGARVELVEWFSQPTAFRSTWEALLASVLEEEDRDQPAPRISRTEVRKVLGKFRKAKRRDHRSGEAQVEGIEHKDLLGWATGVGHELVHVAATLT